MTPEFIAGTIAYLRSQEDEDGYIKPTEDAIFATEKLLKAFYPPGPEPRVVPTADGGVMVYLTGKFRDGGIEIYDDGTHCFVMFSEDRLMLMLDFTPNYPS